MFSSFRSRSRFVVRIETKENIHEPVSRMATIEVSSSIKCVSSGLAICRDVMIKRQNPSRLAEVFRICGEVLLAMELFCMGYQMNYKCISLAQHCVQGGLLDINFNFTIEALRFRQLIGDHFF
jgi:hypothetical protein